MDSISETSRLLSDDPYISPRTISDLESGEEPFKDPVTARRLLGYLEAFVLFAIVCLLIHIGCHFLTSVGLVVYSGLLEQSSVSAPSQIFIPAIVWTTSLLTGSFVLSWCASILSRHNNADSSIMAKHRSWAIFFSCVVGCHFVLHAITALATFMLIDDRSAADAAGSVLVYLFLPLGTSIPVSSTIILIGIILLYVTKSWELPDNRSANAL